MLFWRRCEDTPDLFPEAPEQLKPKRADYKINITLLKEHITQHGYTGINCYNFMELTYA